MLVVMDHKATQTEIDAVVAVIEAKGFTARPIPGGHRVAICVLHNQGPVEPNLFLSLPGVKEAAMRAEATLLVEAMRWAEALITLRVLQQEFPSATWDMLVRDVERRSVEK